MITAFELDGDVASGEAAGHAQGAHGGFRPGVYQTYELHGGHQFPYRLSQFDLQFRRSPEAGAAGQGFVDRREDFRVAVAQQQRPPRADVVDVFVIVFVEKTGALPPLDEARPTADATPRPDRGVDSPGDGKFGSLKQLSASFRAHAWLRHSL